MSKNVRKDFEEILDTIEVDSIFREVNDMFVETMGHYQAHNNMNNFICHNDGVEPLYSIVTVGDKVHTYVKKVDDEEISHFLHDCLDFELDVTKPEQMDAEGSLVFYENLKSEGFSDSAIRYANALSFMNLKYNKSVNGFLQSCSGLEQFLLENDRNYDVNDFMMAQNYILNQISPNYFSTVKNDLSPSLEVDSPLYTPDSRTELIKEEMLNPKKIIH